MEGAHLERETADRSESDGLVEAIPSILICVDGTGRVTRWNAAAEKAFAIDRTRAVGRALSQCPVRWDWPAVADATRACREQSGVALLDSLSFERSDGTKGILGLKLTPLNDAGGILIIGADITERKSLEAQLLQAHKLESIGQLAAGIAHEINTPMQYIGDNVQFIFDASNDLLGMISHIRTFREQVRDPGKQQGAIDALAAALDEIDLDFLFDEIPAAVEQALDGVSRVSKIVRAMKMFSHPIDEAKKAADLTEALESTITVARNEWKYVAEVETEFGADLSTVPCFLGELNQVFLNLLVNAAHAIEANAEKRAGGKGTITISTTRTDSWAEIRIADTGGGIPEAIRHRVFDPFFTTKGVGKGTGQGLAIARSVIVERHKGEVSFETREGEGTTFLIRLPLDDPSEESRSDPLGGQDEYSIR